MSGRTTVLTSHRPSLIGQADIAYIIEEGRVADSGSPEELRSRNEWFSRFMAGDSGYTSQGKSVLLDEAF
jgi:ABC-type multidrug transport system fused ATPase/permease subunit